jgi:TonB family protein
MHTNRCFLFFSLYLIFALHAKSEPAYLETADSFTPKFGQPRLIVAPEVSRHDFSGDSGEVQMELQLNEIGVVTNTEIIKSEPTPNLGQAILDVSKYWAFYPPANKCTPHAGKIRAIAWFEKKNDNIHVYISTSLDNERPVPSRVKKSVPLEFPEEIASLDQSGEMFVRLLIDESGLVNTVEKTGFIGNASGYSQEILFNSAKKKFKKFIFEPLSTESGIQPYYMCYHITYSIDN